MSQSSNYGPIKPAPHSQSRNSLYTDHSNQSEQEKHEVIQLKLVPESHNTVNVDHVKLRDLQGQNNQQSHLPTIKNKFVSPQSIKHNKLPPPKQQSLPKPYHYQQQQRRSLQADTFNSITSSPISHNLKRYLPDEQADNPQTPQERMLRSSQGGRWIRSKSLMTQKEQRTGEYLLRHYFRGGSALSQQVSRYIQYFINTEKLMSQQSHKISLFQPLELIKNRMEGFLQKKINLQNLAIDRPSVEWNQEELTKFYTGYQPLLNEKLQDLKKLKGITLKKYKNCVYFGCMKDGKKDGLGVLHYYSGKFFQGVFQDDYKLEGLQMDENQLYLGNFKKGLRSGEGILKTDNWLVCGSFTEGQYGLGKERVQANRSILGLHQTQQKNVNTRNTYKKGFKIQYSSISVFQNDMVITKNNNNDIYIGNCNNKDEKDGQGLQIFANGDVYIGKYEAGSPEGYGEYYWESGAFYRGKFLSGMRHGMGKWQMIQGDSYEGQYMNDKKNGKGTYLWKNGVKYVGYFENDYRHGYGEMYWSDGKVYKGEWLNGIESNKTIRLDQQSRTLGKGINSIPKNSFRTLQTSAMKKKLPLDKLKSIYNPSNNIN